MGGAQLERVREREKMFGGAEEKPSILIMENRSSLLIRATAFLPRYKCRIMQASDGRRHPPLIN